MTELLRGRERRYFGYLKDAANKIDTPESAKSFRSVMSPIARKVDKKNEKNFKPDLTGQRRFANRRIHRAVQTQIPGLLPALKNSSRFEAIGDHTIDIRSPTFDQNEKRSLYYFWLPKEHRSELCGIFQRHLKVKEKHRIRNLSMKKQIALTGAAAEAAASEKQEYLESMAKDPRITKTRQRRITDIPARIMRQSRKFQPNFWDPQNSAYKNIPDAYGSLRNGVKAPAFDAICHEHFPQTGEHEDLMTCVQEYNRRQKLNQELKADQVDLEAIKDKARRHSLYGTLEDEERRRGLKHVKQLDQYDKESNELWKKQAKLMISAAEYINKLKAGKRDPTPPKQVEKRLGRKGKGAAARSRSSSIDFDEYFLDEKERARRRRAKMKKEKKEKEEAEYDEKFYMEMYLHFLNPYEDVSLKPPPSQLTDVHELRKKMNLDDDPEKDKKLIELLNADSIEELHIDLDKDFDSYSVTTLLSNSTGNTR